MIYLNNYYFQYFKNVRIKFLKNLNLKKRLKKSKYGLALLVPLI